MRTAVTNEMCAHLWANESQSHAHSDSMRFDGDTIRSYREPIGRFVTGTRRRRAVLLATRTWSVTTSHHQSIVWSALHKANHRWDPQAGEHVPIRDLAVFHVEEIDTPAECLEAKIRRVEGLAKQAIGARMAKSRDRAAVAMADALQDARKFAEFFGLRLRLPDDAAEITSAADEARERLAKQEAKRRAAMAARHAQEQAERAARYRETLARWMAGDDVFVSVYDRWVADEPIRLRVRGALIQTSIGAEFPVEHARRAFWAIEQCRAQGREYRHNGHSLHLGSFTVDSIDADGTVHAGCHTVAWDEIERIARQLDLTR